MDKDILLKAFDHVIFDLAKLRFAQGGLLFLSTTVFIAETARIAFLLIFLLYLLHGIISRYIKKAKMRKKIIKEYMQALNIDRPFFTLDREYEKIDWSSFFCNLFIILLMFFSLFASLVTPVALKVLL